MDHLSCFTPGMLALGASSGIADEVTAVKHMEVVIIHANAEVPDSSDQKPANFVPYFWC